MTPLLNGWLLGLADLGCTFVELVQNGKQTQREWDHYIHETGPRGVASAKRWLRKRSGVGILPRPPIWVLDSDSQAETERIETICLEAEIIPQVVRTPGGGSHFYFLLPEMFPREALKNHYCHPRDADEKVIEADWKFGPRTLVVAPGTDRNGKCYLPERAWALPPIADPRMFNKDGQFWKASAPFLVNTRPLRDRLARARYYLENKAPISVDKKSARKTLAGVCSHLVAFLDLDPGTAYQLLTHGKHPWNGRCLDTDGQTYPWSRSELWAACSSSVDSVPAAGVKAWIEAQATRERELLLETLINALSPAIKLPKSNRIPINRVHRLFKRFGSPDLTAKALGDLLSQSGIPRISATRKRIKCIAGLDYKAMIDNILEDRRIHLMQSRGGPGCALIKQQSSLPPRCLPDLAIQSSGASAVGGAFLGLHSSVVGSAASCC